MKRALALGISIGLFVGFVGACGSFGEGGDGSPAGDGGTATSNDASSETPIDAGGDGGSDSNTKADAAPGCASNPSCERVVFATSLQFDPNELGGVKGAHARCNEAAAMANAHARVKGRKFFAWLSDGTTSPSSFMTKGTAAYVLPSGTKIADDWTDLTDGTIDHVIDEDESGMPPATNVVWTGTSSLGIGSGLNCFNWTDTTSTATATVGSTLETNIEWTAVQTDTCDQDHRIFCFEE